MGGSSTNPCSKLNERSFLSVRSIQIIHLKGEVYAGKSADSELETQAVENAILAKKGLWDAYLTIHT